MPLTGEGQAQQTVPPPRRSPPASAPHLTDQAASAHLKGQRTIPKPAQGEERALPRTSRWQRWSACWETPTAISFPTGIAELRRAAEEQAKGICSSCPVRAPCLIFAMDEAYGVWGGLNAEEGRALVNAPASHGKRVRWTGTPAGAAVTPATHSASSGASLGARS